MTQRYVQEDINFLSYSFVNHKPVTVPGKLTKKIIESKEREIIS
jgi:hypothetical protein